MKRNCIICNKKIGNPSFCKGCSKKSWKERLKAIQDRGANYSSKIHSARYGRPKFGSKIMQDRFGDND